MHRGNYILSDPDFRRLGDFIFSNYGIKMPPGKKSMLQARLQKRLRANQMTSFKEYCDFVFSGKEGETEIIHMIDVVSTNKTDFFREPGHFDFLRNVALPELAEKNPSGTLRAWSSACSSGEEVYTLAMVINEFTGASGKIQYSILGTDISTHILDLAIKAIYPAERVTAIPHFMRLKYLMRNKNKEKNDVRIVPELRDRASFQRLNLMDANYAVPKDFDIIFCRNVLIYFDRETQRQVISRLCRHLKTGGYFFLGHSESITGLALPLKTVRPTIYRKTDPKSMTA